MLAEQEQPVMVYLNDAIVPIQDANVSVLDRGFLFGDGVYELVRVFSGTPLAMDAHVQRLGASLQATGIVGFDPDRYHQIVKELLEATKLVDACVYLQVTRGQGPTRNHLPVTGTPPTVFAMATPSPSVNTLDRPLRTSVTLEPDERWLRCEIKAITLLPNVLAMQSANEHGASEAILHRDGFITEGTSSNVLMVIDGVVTTPPVSTTHSILHGTMRGLAIKAADEIGLQVQERPVAVKELQHVTEMAITSSRRLLHMVTHVDDLAIPDTLQPESIFATVFTRMRRMIISAIEDRDPTIQMAPKSRLRQPETRVDA